MRNALVIGFNLDLINKCVDNKLFNCKIWITNNKNNKYDKVILSSLFDMNIKLKQHTHSEHYQQIFNKYFHMFVHSISREKHIAFSYFDYVDLFALHFYHFYHILKDNKIDIIISSNFLHETDNLLYGIAKDIFNIKLIIFNQSLFPNKFWYMDSLDDYGFFKAAEKLLPLQNKSQDITFNTPPQINLFYMKESFTKKLKRDCLYKFIFKDLEKIFSKKRKITFNNQWNKLIKCIQYQKNLKKYSITNINLDVKYVYFPLHLQPEMTTSILGGKYADQLLAIEKLSNFIPNDWSIYVKENPKQSYYQRDTLFFKRLLSIKKVKLLDKNINTHLLRQKCQFLSTISGTAGWEALSDNKNVLLFGKAWYRNLPGTFIFDDNLSFERINSYKIDSNNFTKSFNKLINKSFDGIIDENYIAIYKKYDAEQNLNNIYHTINLIMENN